MSTKCGAFGKEGAIIQSKGRIIAVLNTEATKSNGRKWESTTLKMCQMGPWWYCQVLLNWHGVDLKFTQQMSFQKRWRWWQQWKLNNKNKNNETTTKTPTKSTETENHNSIKTKENNKKNIKKNNKNNNNNKNSNTNNNKNSNNNNNSNNMNNNKNNNSSDNNNNNSSRKSLNTKLSAEQFSAKHWALSAFSSYLST